MPAPPSQPDSEAKSSALASGEEPFPDNSLAEGSAASGYALRSEVQMNDFQVRLLPRGRANLFRYALFGLAGLAFLGAFGFLLAGIGLGRRR